MVVGAGGYVSGPVVLTAALLKRADTGDGVERVAGLDQSRAGAFCRSGGGFV